MTAFHDWLRTAAPGDALTYYIGHLAQDRGDLEVVPARGKMTPELECANAAWRAYGVGLVTLTQRAIGPINNHGAHPAFHYIAQRTHK